MDSLEAPWWLFSSGILGRCWASPQTVRHNALPSGLYVRRWQWSASPSWWERCRDATLYLCSACLLRRYKPPSERSLNRLKRIEIVLLAGNFWGLFQICLVSCKVAQMGELNVLRCWMKRETFLACFYYLLYTLVVIIWVFWVYDFAQTLCCFLSFWTLTLSLYCHRILVDLGFKSRLSGKYQLRRIYLQ